jgi:glutamate-1-semialdehyde aminotransferase
MKFDNSRNLLERAKKVIPSATQTFSKGPNQWVGNVSPNYLARGDGAWIQDVDGNRFLDYLMALGPIILGYGNHKVNDTVKCQIDDGIVFSQMHPLEVEVSELLCELIPCAEMVRFGKNGSDVTTAAIRVTRAFTGRDRIAVCGYHGWHDWYIGTTTRDLGIPKAVKELTSSFDYNDIGSLEVLFEKFPSEIAAVIMEPVGIEKPQGNFLQDVKALCKSNGTLLVFDEIVTGFRMGLGGAQEYFGVTPDIACFGKAMANGFPISAVVGRRPVMEMFDKIFFSGTFGGEAASLAACKATITEMLDNQVIDYLWKSGDNLLAEIGKRVEKHGLNNVVKLLGYGVRFVMAFPCEDEYQARLRRSYFMQECIKRGLLFFGSHNITASHGEEEIRFTLDVYDQVFPLFAAAYQANDFESRLEGACVEPIFRKP